MDIGSIVAPYKNYFESGGTTTTTNTPADPEKKGSFWDTLGNIAGKVGDVFAKSDGTPMFDLNKIIKLPTVNLSPDQSSKKTINIVLIAGGALLLITLLMGRRKRR